MPIPAVGAALMGLARVAAPAIGRAVGVVGTQAGRKGLMEGAKKIGVQAKDKAAGYAKDKAMEKVTEMGQTNPMDAAMEHMKEKQKQDAAQTHEMMMRTKDKASGSQTTTAGFGTH